MSNDFRLTHPEAAPRFVRPELVCARVFSDYTPGVIYAPAPEAA